MTMLPVISRVRRGASLLVPLTAITLAGAAMPTSAQVVTLGDLIPRVDVLETDIGLLRTDTTSNTNALTAHGGLLSGLRTDLGGLGSDLAGVNTDVADLKVQIGDLRGLLDGLPDIVGPDGPLDLPGIIETLNTQTLANASNLATVNVSVSNLRTNDNSQDVRLDDHERRINQTTNIVNAHEFELDDHERRITRDTDDIRRHDLAITDLQSQMASGFAGVDDELRHQNRRIDKATEGVAMALAMKSLDVPEDKNFALSGSFGAFAGQTALALAGGIRATDALQFDAGVAVGLEEGSVGGRAGATLAW